ncbi:hypothetical protein ACIPV2_00260 [Microbacterium sp. NPDC089987]|uniref:hypothetical protein n=1 Tax=Microbacterium sp. NPDC089987 TaxID=3364202 RepID=UPI0037F997A3
MSTTKQASGDSASAIVSDLPTEEESSSRNLKWVWLIVGLIAVLAGGVVLQLWGDALGESIADWWTGVGRWWHKDGWSWVSNWLTTAGFGGFAAVVAASLAFSGARHQARLNSWWQRAEWALNLYTKPNAKDMERRVGAAAVAALQSSRLAKRDEKRFLAEVAAAVTFDPKGDGVGTDDWSEAVADVQLSSTTNGDTPAASIPGDSKEERVGDGR